MDMPADQYGRRIFFDEIFQTDAAGMKSTPDFGLERLLDPARVAVIPADDMKETLDRLNINPVVFSGGEWTALDVKAVLDPTDLREA